MPPSPKIPVPPSDPTVRKATRPRMVTTNRRLQVVKLDAEDLATVKNAVWVIRAAAHQRLLPTGAMEELNIRILPKCSVPLVSRQARDVLAPAASQQRPPVKAAGSQQPPLISLAPLPRSSPPASRGPPPSAPPTPPSLGAPTAAAPPKFSKPPSAIRVAIKGTSTSRGRPPSHTKPTSSTSAPRNASRR